jgi:PKD repeat protein
MQNDKRTTQFFVGEEVLFTSDCSQNASSYRWVVRHNGTESVFTSDKLEYKFEETGSYEVALTVSTGSMRSQTSELVLVKEFTSGTN